jgi:hypothetical protein
MDDTTNWMELLASGSEGDATDTPLAVMGTSIGPVFQSDNLDLLQPEPDLSASIRTTCDGDDIDAHKPSRSPVNAFLGQEMDHESAQRSERQRQLSARRKRTHRERVKNELVELTTQVAALERELRRLEDAQASAGPETCCNELAAEWRKLAVLNHKRRRAAERLNEQLRRKIARNSTLLGDLAQIPSSFTWELDQLPIDQRSSLYSKLHEDSLLLGFAQELDAVYARTDEATGRFPSEPEEQWSRSVSRRWDGESQKDLFEIVDSFVLPFGYTKASRALWKSMTQVYETDPGVLNSEVIECPDSTIAVHFRIYGSAFPGSSMSCSFVTRRYVERERTVVVWRALSEGLEGSMAGVATDETGWSILRSVPSDTCFSVDGEGATVMDTFVQITPLVSDGTKRRGRAQDFESFVSRVISSVSEDGDAIARLMDGLLLTQEPPESTPTISMQ